MTLPTMKYWHKRNYNWRHCGLIGSACRSIKDMQIIQTAQSTTREQKLKAAKIEQLMRELSRDIASRRVEPDGSIKELTQ